MKLPVPPYGKPLLDLQLALTPPTNDVYLFIGKKAWERAKAASFMRPTRTLCLPPEKTPMDYIWPVAMCDILIIDTGTPDENFVHDLVAVLFSYKAVVVRYIYNDDQLTVFKRT